MDMLRLAVALVFLVAGSDATGKCQKYKRYQEKAGLRAVSAQLVPPVSNSPLQIPVLFWCIYTCNTISICKAFQVVRNDTCELVMLPMHPVTVDKETTLYTMVEFKCPNGFGNLLHPRGFVPSCYKFVLQSTNWAASRAICRSLGGDLVSIETEEEQLHLQYTIGNDTNLRLTGSNGYWTSGSDETGTWIWKATGLTFTYQNWGPGIPNNPDSALWIGYLGRYEWDDTSRLGSTFSLCEIRAML